MKLTSPALEKRVRTDTRNEMRLDKALWKDYRRHRKGWLRRKLAHGNKFLVYLFCSWIAILAAFRGHGIRAVLVGIALYATATTLFRGLKFRLNVVQGFDRALFLHFPVSDPDFLRYEWKKFGWSWVGAFLLFLTAYSITALSADFPAQFTGIALAAILQSLCGLTISIWLLMLVPKLKIVSSALPVYVLMIACLWLPATAVDFLWSAVLLVPGGWISHSFASLAGASPKIELFLLVPAGVIPLSLPIAFYLTNRQLSAVLERQTADDALNTLLDTPEAGEEQPSQPASLGTARLISNDDIVRRPNWKTGGWIEQIVAAWFSEEDKLVAELMLAQNIGEWSKRWRVAALISAIGIAITVLAPLPPWVLFLPMVAAALWGAPLFGGLWPGFRGAPTFGGVIPTYAVFPVGYLDISRAMFKANIVRVLAWAPMVVVYATALATRLGNTPRYGFVVGIEVVVIVMTMQPVMITGHFSSGTNDTRQINRYTLSFFGFALILLIFLVVTTASFFVADTLLVKLLSMIGVFGCTSVVWASYMVLFHRGRIDLLSRPR